MTDTTVPTLTSEEIRIARKVMDILPEFVKQRGMKIPAHFTANYGNIQEFVRWAEAITASQNFEPGEPIRHFETLSSQHNKVGWIFLDQHATLSLELMNKPMLEVQDLLDAGRILEAVTTRGE